MGSRMSVGPSWAMIDPSRSSTIECTTDCGWITTSICPGPTPNSQRASITSRPLFISVAESMVIFRPIRHVGWRSASSGPTFLSSAAEWLRNGPPDAVRISRPISPRLRPCRHWWMALCSLSTGQDRHALPRGRRGDDGAGHHQDFLVGQRDGLAGVDGGQHGLQRGGPRRGAEQRRRRQGAWRPPRGPRRRRSAAAAGRRPGARAPGRARAAWPWPPRGGARARSGARAGSRWRRRPGPPLPGGRRAPRRPTARCGRSIRWTRGWRSCASRTERAVM